MEIERGDSVRVKERKKEGDTERQDLKRETQNRRRYCYRSCLSIIVFNVLSSVYNMVVVVEEETLWLISFLFCVIIQLSYTRNYHCHS